MDQFTSSPPLLAQELPNLPLQDTRDSLLNELPNTSSDPPLFSSDDTPDSAGVENYAAPRLRKKRKGAWWKLRTDSSSDDLPVAAAKKQKLSRNIDSGVWMASDDTDTSSQLDITSGTEEIPQPSHFTSIHSRKMATWSSGIAHPDTSSPEGRASQIITRGVEANREVYDLSSLRLGSLSNEMVEPLNSVIRSVHDPGRLKPGQEYYASFIPDITLNLNNNLLQALPPAFWSLQHLTVLILRNNELTEIPSQICQLKQLRTLDLAQNKLRYLPYEILHILSELRSLNTFANPLLQGIDAEILRNHASERGSALAHWYSLLPTQDLQKDYELETAWLVKSIEVYARSEDSSDENDPRFIGYSPPIYYRWNGSVDPGSPCPPTPDQKYVNVVVKHYGGTHGMPNPWYTPPSKATCIPSLFELALRRATSLLSRDEALELFGDETPEVVAKGLDIAEATKSLTGAPSSTCSMCGRPYIVARAEWMEFWSRAWLDFVPLRRKVCSWGCVPEELREGV